jgi:hypothetical protein
MKNFVRAKMHRVRLIAGLALAALIIGVPQVRAQDDKEDYDAYTLRFETYWFYAKPSGTITSAGNNGTLDLQRDVQFDYYNTFAGKVDWKFTRKNHLYFIAIPFNQTKTVTLDRTVIFRGQTFNVNSVATGSLNNLALVPGYQYDFIRRKRISFGVQVQLDLFDINASLNAAAQVNNGVPQAATFSTANLRAPLPVAGPTFRFYFTPRLSVQANVLGMYFFGYGNFVSSAGTLGFKVTKNLAVRGGYQLGSRLNVNTETDRIGLSLTQKGALAGLEISF